MCKRAGDATRLHFMLESSLPVTDPIHAGKTNRRIAEKLKRTRARSFSRLVLASIFGLILLSQALPALAGWVPAYVRAQGLESGVLLEWATISEYNLSGFEILCKLESEPDDAYHPIASLPAEGSLDRGAEYSYLVDSGLEVGQTYCFRIQEIALFEEPPEYVDVCGYGLGIEPAITPVPVNPQTGSVEVVATAVFTPPPVQSVDNTPTPITILPSAATGGGAVPGATSPPATSAPADLPPTPTPTQFAESNTATPTPTMVSQSPQASPVSGSPLASPESAIPAPQSGAAATTQPAITAVEPAAGLAANTANGPSATGGTGSQPDAAPAQSYVVVTATPTSDAEPVGTFTPLPTTTPSPQNALLATAANPTVDNLILMTLCFTFLGAGGLGALGLTATALYIRSRKDV